MDEVNGKGGAFHWKQIVFTMPKVLQKLPLVERLCMLESSLKFGHHGLTGPRKVHLCVAQNYVQLLTLNMNQAHHRLNQLNLAV
jgi:hypothetical protein